MTYYTMHGLLTKIVVADMANLPFGKQQTTNAGMMQLLPNIIAAIIKKNFQLCVTSEDHIQEIVARIVGKSNGTFMPVKNICDQLIAEFKLETFFVSLRRYKVRCFQK